MSNENKAVSLYGNMLMFSRLRLHSTDIRAIVAAVSTMHMDGAIIPVVLEASDVVATDDFDLSALVNALWDCGVGVIGVLDGVLNAQADALKLVRFPADGSRIERLTEVHKPAPVMDGSADTVNTISGEQSKTSSQNLSSSLIHEQVVRAGQAVEYLGGDLVVTGSINRGGEVITDGSLHIYGKGEGRLVAGATGDERARIFCQHFDPTLVSVAGVYCLKDDVPSEMIGQAVQVGYGTENELIFTLMKQ